MADAARQAAARRDEYSTLDGVPRAWL